MRLGLIDYEGKLLLSAYGGMKLILLVISSDLIYSGLLVLVLVLLLFVFSKIAQIITKEKRKQKIVLNKYKDDYFLSLNKLKKNPTNADLKQETLLLGRKFSELSREQQGAGSYITVYDEMALMNDINAACAAASTADLLSVEDRLAKLLKLKEKSLVSEEEYETRRQKILDKI